MVQVVLRLEILNLESLAGFQKIYKNPKCVQMYVYLCMHGYVHLSRNKA